MLHTTAPSTRCFIDANIFVYHLVFTPDISDTCTDSFERIERGEVEGFTSAVSVAEAVHKVMLAEAIALHHLPHKGLPHRLQNQRQLIGSLSKHHDVIKTVRALKLHVEPTTLDLLDAAAALSPQHHLLTNDSLTIAAMNKLPSARPRDKRRQLRFNIRHSGMEAPIALLALVTRKHQSLTPAPPMTARIWRKTRERLKCSFTNDRRL